MGRKNNRRRRSVPFCAEPDKHLLVNAREGSHWRKKRGSVTKAVLNEAFALNVDMVKITGPIAKQVVQVLRPWFTGLEPGRVTVRISNGLAWALKTKKQLDYSGLQGMEVQREYGLDNLLPGRYRVDSTEDVVTLALPVGAGSVKRHNRLVSHFYFELVLLSGQPGDAHGLRVESRDSRLYGFDEEGQEPCVLQLPLPQPGVPWMLLLKVSCLEGNELAAHARHYGMRVVGVSGL